MKGCSSKVFSPGGDKPHEAFVLSWFSAGRAVFHPLVSTGWLAVFAPLYMAEVARGDPEWLREGLSLPLPQTQLVPAGTA